MHELSLCRSIHQIVDGARQERRVLTVHLQVGHLRQVIPETLVYCWDLVTADGPLAGARLEIDHIPVVLSCHTCGAETTVEHALVLTCSACGGGNTQPIRGEEFMVTSLDLAPARVTSPPTEEATHGPIPPT
ncbi:MULTISPECIES: hydrogenase maturation nickel metallochaperone HypA [Nocardioides]|uniref:hydrogenase maturation nickel metallochaperone HypA n=1 Tax=Nocardioides TaxID=1839 RepID=UPI00032EABA2|nr:MULTISPECIES: hydrogenase maturation nickel metallochaperone HypA [Nocardioides]EON22097.1 hydrogenase nickel incorporation protein [Nocardioides sp. CF8]